MMVWLWLYSNGRGEGASDWRWTFGEKGTGDGGLADFGVIQDTPSAF